MADPLHIPESARCLGCGYALRDLPACRCPECGRAFDPGRPETMRFPESKPSPPPPRFTPRQERGWTAWAVTAAAVSLTLDLSLGGGPEGRRGALFAVVALWAASRARGWFDPPASRSERRARRAKWSAAYVPLLILGGVGYTCTYGTLLGVGGVGVAHSQLGGPCSNGVICVSSRQLGGDWYVWWQR